MSRDSWGRVGAAGGRGQGQGDELGEGRGGVGGQGGGGRDKAMSRWRGGGLRGIPSCPPG